MFRATDLVLQKPLRELRDLRVGEWYGDSSTLERPPTLSNAKAGVLQADTVSFGSNAAKQRIEFGALR
jgi:hypothetical protein